MKILKLKLDDALNAQLEAAAARDDRTPEHYVLRAIKQALNHDPEKERQIQTQYESLLRARIAAEFRADEVMRRVEASPGPGVETRSGVGQVITPAPVVAFNQNPNKPVETFGLMDSDPLQGQTGHLPKEFEALRADAPKTPPPPTIPGGNSLFENHKV